MNEEVRGAPRGKFKVDVVGGAAGVRDVGRVLGASCWTSQGGLRACHAGPV